MDTTRPRRDDPCPCGSGKKYKHCCKPKEQARPRLRTTLPAAPTSRRPYERQLEQIRRLGPEALKRLPPEQAEELRRRQQQIESLAAYNEKQPGVEAASRVLERHRAEFEALLADPQEAQERADRLFAETTFAPLHFSSDDIARAFEAVGYPPQLRAGRLEDLEIVEKAILYLATPQQRLYLSRRLLVLLPQYVASRRYLDAWLIQYCAFLTQESPERANPFLLAMFDSGWRAWADELDTLRGTLLREVGLDREAAAGMTMDELEALLEKHLADPARKAALTALFAAGTRFGDQAQAAARELDQNMVEILKREDAQHLLLSGAEMGPWLPVLLQRLAPHEARMKVTMAEQRPPEPELVQGFTNALLDTAAEMAAAIFVPDRLALLIAGLSDYRRFLSRAGAKEDALYAHAAYRRLLDEKEPNQNPFVIAVCFASLHGALTAAADEVWGRR